MCRHKQTRGFDVRPGNFMTRLLFALAVLLSLAAASASSALAQAFVVGHLAADNSQVDGAQCEFSDRTGVILRADWVSKFWMRIDGALIAFEGTRTDAQKERELRTRRWKESLEAQGVAVSIDLAQTGRSEDGAAFKGRVVVKRNGVAKTFAVKGGCGA